MSIKKGIRYLNTLLTEYFTYPAIYLSFAAFLLLCMFGPIAKIKDNEYSVFELIMNKDIMANAVKMLECNSFAVMRAFDESPWFSVAAPVITAMPALAVYVQNAQNTRRQILVRMNKRVYSSGLFWSAFLTGFLIALIGILLYASVVFSAFPRISDFPDDAEFINAVYGSSSSVRFYALMKKVINCCIICGVFPILTLIAYQLLHDRFLAMTLPMMVQYVSLKASIMFGAWLYSDESLYSNGWLNFIQLLFPSNCMLHHYYWEGILHLPFAFFFIMTGIIIIVLYLLFDRLNRCSIGEGV